MFLGQNVGCNPLMKNHTQLAQKQSRSKNLESPGTSVPCFFQCRQSLLRSFWAPLAWIEGESYWHHKTASLSHWFSFIYSTRWKVRVSAVSALQRQSWGLRSSSAPVFCDRDFLDRKYIFFLNIYSTIQVQVTAYALGWEPDSGASDEV